GVGEEHRAPVRDLLGPDGLRTLVEALYVLDLGERLRLVLERIFERDETLGRVPASEPRSGDAIPLERANLDSHSAAMRLSRLDPIVTEVTRLRCAHYHDCST